VWDARWHARVGWRGRQSRRANAATRVALARARCRSLAGHDCELGANVRRGEYERHIGVSRRTFLLLARFTANRVDAKWTR